MISGDVWMTSFLVNIFCYLLKLLVYFLRNNDFVFKQSGWLVSKVEYTKLVGRGITVALIHTGAVSEN